MSQPTVNSRPATWAGTSGPILYKFTSTNYSNAGYRMEVEIWDATAAAKIADAKYYANGSGAVTVDVSAFLRSNMSLDLEADLTSGTVYEDVNWIKYYIKYQEVWTASSESQVNDSGNPRWAIYGGLQIGSTNDFTDYVDTTYNFLTQQKEGSAISNLNFLLSFFTPESVGFLRSKKYLNSVIQTTEDTFFNKTTDSILFARFNEDISSYDELRASILSKTLDTSWTSRTVISGAWTDITYGNGLFVAVGTNLVQTSPDGITWTSRTPADSVQWRGVTYGNGLYVAVANNGTTAQQVMTSTDGINWTSRTSAVANQWESVTYGNGLYVAVSFNGTGDRIMTSPDGITWTTRVNPVDFAFYDVTYGNGLFVAVANGGALSGLVQTSSDGITWTARNGSEVAAWTSVTYGNNLFVAVSNNAATNRVMTSPDGITWTGRSASAASAWFSVIYGNGIFVAVSTGTSNNGMWSYDGITWTTKSLGAIAYDCVSFDTVNNRFMALSTSGTVGHSLDLTETELSEVKTINIIEDCQNIVMLAWRNSLGGWECHPFTYNQEYTFDYGNGKKAKRLTLYANHLTLNQWEAIQGLNTIGEQYKTPITEMTTSLNRTSAQIGQSVYVLNSDGTKTGVVVIPQANTTFTKQKKHQATVTIEYPEIFLQ